MGSRTSPSRESMPIMLRGPMADRATRPSPKHKRRTATISGPTGAIAGAIAGEVDRPMNLRDQLARVIARDSRYTIESYAFVLESLKCARTHKLQEQRKRRDRDRASRPRKRAQPAPAGEAETELPGHVTGAEICQAARHLALRYYGLMAITVLNEW